MAEYDETVVKGERKSDNGVAKFIHFMSCIILLLGGGTLLGYSIYLQVTDQGLIPGLDLDDEGGFLAFVLSTAIVGIIVGSALVVISLVGLFAFKKGCCGFFAGLTYAVFMFVILAALVFIAVITLKFHTDTQGDIMTNAALEVWEESVGDSEYVEAVCDIQQYYNCNGFFKNECAGCDPGIEGSCTSEQNMRCAPCMPLTNEDNLPGCYNAVVDAYDHLYLPIGIGASVLGALALTDIVVIWFI